MPELMKPADQEMIDRVNSVVGSGNDLIRILANLTTLRTNKELFQSVVTEYITSPFDVPTPKEKIKKRPDGFDYIESTWMDKQFKEYSPLYSIDLLHYSENMGWVTAIVHVTDRIAGNSELGGSSVRIQVKKGTLEPTFRDIVDKGNNVAAVITRAIKNAQSRFGHGADVYGKRESARTNEENERYDVLLKEITKINKDRAKLFREGWEELGTDYTEFLDKWQIYIDRNQKFTEANGYSTVDEAVVMNGNSSQKIKIDMNKIKI